MTISGSIPTGWADSGLVSLTNLVIPIDWMGIKYICNECSVWRQAFVSYDNISRDGFLLIRYCKLLERHKGLARALGLLNVKTASFLSSLLSLCDMLGFKFSCHAMILVFKKCIFFAQNVLDSTLRWIRTETFCYNMNIWLMYNKTTIVTLQFLSYAVSCRIVSIV